MSSAAQVDLAGHGGGDKGGAVVAQALDGLFDLGGEGVELGDFAVEVGGDSLLFGKWRQWKSNTAFSYRGEVFSLAQEEAAGSHAGSRVNRGFGRLSARRGGFGTMDENERRPRRICAVFGTRRTPNGPGLDARNLTGLIGPFR